MLPSPTPPKQTPSSTTADKRRFFYKYQPHGICYQSHPRKTQIAEWTCVFWIYPLHCANRSVCSGPKVEEMTYAFIPYGLEYLRDFGNHWSYSCTHDNYKCFNRKVGDVHFSPAEVEGFEYWVCCLVDRERVWRPYCLGDAHPLTRELVLLHSPIESAPRWVCSWN